MGVSGPIVWTQQLQDPLHREEQEIHFTLSGKAKCLSLAIKSFRVSRSHAFSYAIRTEHSS
jgi:hypothetical protein